MEWVRASARAGASKTWAALSVGRDRTTPLNRARVAARVPGKGLDGDAAKARAKAKDKAEDKDEARARADFARARIVSARAAQAGSGGIKCGHLTVTMLDSAIRPEYEL